MDSKKCDAASTDDGGQVKRAAKANATPSRDVDDHPAQTPAAAWLGTMLAKVAGEQAAELQIPLPDRFIRGVDAAFASNVSTSRKLDARLTCPCC